MGREAGFPVGMDERLATTEPSTDVRSDARRPVPWWALGSAAFVLLAVAIEVLGGQWANSPAPGWAETLVPVAWPPALRVVWWLAAAAATATFHVGVARSGERPRPVFAVLTTGMFVAFAAGIAFGAEWATWH